MDGENCFRCRSVPGARFTRAHGSAYCAAIAALVVGVFLPAAMLAKPAPRECILIDDGWRFKRDDPPGISVNLTYDSRVAEGARQEGESPSKLKLEPDRAMIRADGSDLSFVTVRVVDDHDRIVPRANNRITFKIEGPGEIVATDNGDPTSFEPFQAHDRRAFNGLCLVIIRGVAGKPGKIGVYARAEELQPGTAIVQTAPDPQDGPP